MVALLACAASIAAAGDGWGRNLDRAVEIILENTDLRFRIQKLLKNPRGTFFDKRGDACVAQCPGHQIEFSCVPANPQEARWIRAHLLGLE
jgi:hypothetical protein